MKLCLGDANFSPVILWIRWASYGSTWIVKKTVLLIILTDNYLLLKMKERYDKDAQKVLSVDSPSKFLKKHKIPSINLNFFQNRLSFATFVRYAVRNA